MQKSKTVVILLGSALTLIACGSTGERNLQLQPDSGPAGKGTGGASTGGTVGSSGASNGGDGGSGASAGAGGSAGTGTGGASGGTAGAGGVPTTGGAGGAAGAAGAAGAGGGPCTLNSTICDLGVPAICDANGVYQPQAACPNGSPVCENGSCVQCGTGSIGCNGNTPRTCTAANIWQDGTPCAGTKKCSNGACTNVVLVGGFATVGPAPVGAGAVRLREGAFITGGRTCNAASTVCVRGALVP